MTSLLRLWPGTWKFKLSSPQDCDPDQSCGHRHHSWVSVPLPEKILVTLGWRSCYVHKYSTSAPGPFLVGSVIKVIKHHNFCITSCFSFAVHIMGDVKLVTSTRVSKTSLTLSPPVPAEAPAFTLPPRNIRVQLGATARFEGKVRNRHWRVSALGFALSWSWPGGCKGSEVVPAIWELYSRRTHQCLPSWGGRSMAGLFLCRGEWCKTWALQRITSLSMPGTEVIVREKLLQGVCLVSMLPYCNSTYSATAHSHPCIPNLCLFMRHHVWHKSNPAAACPS